MLLKALHRSGWERRRLFACWCFSSNFSHLISRYLCQTITTRVFHFGGSASGTISRYAVWNWFCNEAVFLGIEDSFDLEFTTRISRISEPRGDRKISFASAEYTLNFPGREIPAIWHTSIVVFGRLVDGKFLDLDWNFWKGRWNFSNFANSHFLSFVLREYFYGGQGIESCGPGETILQEPMQIMPLGKSEVPYSLFLEYIFELGETSFQVRYLSCITFTREFISVHHVRVEALFHLWKPDQFSRNSKGNFLSSMLGKADRDLNGANYFRE